MSLIVAGLQQRFVRRLVPRKTRRVGLCGIMFERVRCVSERPTDLKYMLEGCLFSQETNFKSCYARLDAIREPRAGCMYAFF